MMTDMSIDSIIYEIDQYVYDLQLLGVDERSIFQAMREYLAIHEDLTNVASV